MAGSAEMSSSVSRRLRRAPLISSTIDISTAARMLTTTLFPSETSHGLASEAARMFSDCKPTPIESDTPTIRAFFGLRPSCWTVRMPSTKSSPITIIRIDPVTGPGIVSSTATTLGKSASPISIAPIAYPRGARPPP